jgi:hypothetical protein
MMILRVIAFLRNMLEKSRRYSSVKNNRDAWSSMSEKERFEGIYGYVLQGRNLDYIASIYGISTREIWVFFNIRRKEGHFHMEVYS